MQTHQVVRKFVQEHNLIRFVVKIGGAVFVALLFLISMLGVNVIGAHAQTLNICSVGDRTYSVVSGDTLEGIAARYNTKWGTLASYNHIANPDMIHPNQRICIPGHGPVSSIRTVSTSTPRRAALATKVVAISVVASNAPTGKGNPFPYPACTWWADQRYYQLHGVFVPWTSNAMAWQWTERAHASGWHVSSKPGIGAILDLQPWVQGAYGGGHVAVVERVLANGHVIASSMSWGWDPYAVTYWEFVPGPGVTFISR